MIYLASPYSHPDPKVVSLRFGQTREYTANCILRGESVFSPIVYAHEFATAFGIPTTAAFWEKFNNHMIRNSTCVRVLQLVDWQSSVGVAAEIKLAENIGLPVEFVWPE